MKRLRFSSHVRTTLMAVATLLSLAACSSGPTLELPLQRFEAAYRYASDKFAAGDLGKAATAFAQAERIAALYDRRNLRTQALLSMGAVAATQEQDAQALQAYTRAVDEAQGLADVRLQSVALAGLADTLRRMGDLAAALHTYERALGPAVLQPGSAEQMQTLMGLALVWFAQGKSEQAWNTLGTLETQARAVSSPVLAGVLANQAVLLRERSDFQGAIGKAQEALELNRRASNPMALAADLELLGQLYVAVHQPQDAQTQWERALRIVQETGQNKAAQRLDGLLGALSSRR